MKDELEEILEDLEKTELEEYQEFVASCPQPKDNDFKPYWAATQMICEAAEVLELYEKQYRKGGSIDWLAIQDEIGDVLWGIACICNYENMKLDDVILNNISKLSKRHNLNESS